MESNPVLSKYCFGYKASLPEKKDLWRIYFICTPTSSHPPILASHLRSPGHLCSGISAYTAGRELRSENGSYVPRRYHQLSE